jgi:hypothetical protein
LRSTDVRIFSARKKRLLIGFSLGFRGRRTLGNQRFWPSPEFFFNFSVLSGFS